MTDNVLLIHGFVLTFLALLFLVWHLRTGGRVFDAVTVSWMGYVFWVGLAVLGAAYYGPDRPTADARNYTLFLVYMGTIGYMLGLRFTGLSTRVSRIIPVPRDNMTPQLLWFLLVILSLIWALGYWMVFNFSVRAAGLFLHESGMGGVGILAILGLVTFQGRPFSRVLLLVVLIAVIALYASTAFSRRPAPAMLVAGFLLFYHIKVRFSSAAAKMVTVVAMVVAGMALVVYLTQTRGERHHGLAARTRPESAVETVLRLVPDHSSHSYVVLEHIVATTPGEFPYLYGSGLVPLFTWMVPRHLWPGKPVATGYVYSIRFLGEDPPQWTVAATIFGEMYCNFGPVGVFVGMMVIGLLVRALSNILHANQSNLTLMAIWFVAVPDFFSEWRGDLTSMTVQGLLKGVTLLFLCWAIGLVLYTPPERLLSQALRVREQERQYGND